MSTSAFEVENHTTIKQPENYTEFIQDQTSLVQKSKPNENIQPSSLQIQKSCRPDTLIDYTRNPLLKIRENLSEALVLEEAEFENERSKLQHQKRINIENQIIRKWELEGNQLLQKLNHPSPVFTVILLIWKKFKFTINFEKGIITKKLIELSFNFLPYPIYVSFYNRKTKEREVITDGFASNELRFFLSTKSLPFEKHWISKYSIPLDEEHHDPSTYFIHYKTCKSSLAVEPFTAVFNPHKVFITDFFFRRQPTLKAIIHNFRMFTCILFQ